MRAVKSIALVLAACTFGAALSPAMAYDRQWHGDIHHFHEYDYDLWRGGSWFHGPHGGHDGWWWIVNGGWYFYPHAIYPYPDPYVPPTMIVESAPVAAMGVPPSYVYFCPSPEGYYPYVPECFGPWQRIASVGGVIQPPLVVQPPVVAQSTVVAPPAPVVMPADWQREADDRQLNSLAAEFQNVDLNGAHARSRLRGLEKKVEAFRQTLYTRSYNAMDILRDADGLEHRIAAQRDKLPIKVAPAPTPMTPPATP